jgi:hypothetical protein
LTASRFGIGDGCGATLVSARADPFQHCQITGWLEAFVSVFMLPPVPAGTCARHAATMATEFWRLERNPPFENLIASLFWMKGY